MSDIWFCCKQTDKVVELSDCLECKDPKNCLSLASYQQGRADTRYTLDKITNFLNSVDENSCSLGILRASIREVKQILKEQGNSVK